MADEKNLQESSQKQSTQKEEKGSIRSYFKQKSATPVKTKCEKETNLMDVEDEVIVIEDAQQLKADTTDSIESVKPEKTSNYCTRETGKKSCVNAGDESIRQETSLTETPTKCHIKTTDALAKQTNVFAFMMNNRSKQNEEQKMTEDEKAHNEAQMEEKIEIGKDEEPVMVENMHDSISCLQRKAGLVKELPVNLVCVNTARSKVKCCKIKGLKKEEENMDADNEEIQSFNDTSKAKQKNEVDSGRPINNDEENEVEIIDQKEADKHKKIDSYSSKTLLSKSADSKLNRVENDASKVVFSSASSLGNAFAVLMTNRHKINRISSVKGDETSEETREYGSKKRKGTGKRGRKRKRSTSEEFDSSLLDFEVTPKKKKGRESKGKSLGRAKRLIKKNLTYDSGEDEEEVIVARNSRSRSILNSESSVEDSDTVIEGIISGSTPASSCKNENESSSKLADTVSSLDSAEGETNSACTEMGESEMECELEASANKEIEYDSEYTGHSEFENRDKEVEIRDADNEEEEDDEVNGEEEDEDDEVNGEEEDEDDEVNGEDEDDEVNEEEADHNVNEDDDDDKLYEEEDENDVIFEMKSKIKVTSTIKSQMLKDEVQVANEREEIFASKERSKPVVKCKSNETLALGKEDLINTSNVKLTAEEDNISEIDYPFGKKSRHENDKILVNSNRHMRENKQLVEVDGNVITDVRNEIQPLQSPSKVEKSCNDGINTKQPRKLSKQKNIDGNSSVDGTYSGTPCRVSARIIANAKQLDESSSEGLAETPVKRRKKVNCVESDEDDDNVDDKNVSNQDIQETKSVNDSKCGAGEEGMVVPKKGNISSFFQKITKEENEVKRSKNIITIKADVHASYDGIQQSNKLKSFEGKGTKKDKFNICKGNTHMEKKSTRRSNRKMEKELDFNKIELLEQIAIASPKKTLPVEENGSKLAVRKKVLECTKETVGHSSQVEPSKKNINPTSEEKDKKVDSTKKNSKKAGRVKLRKASGNSVGDTIIEERSKGKQTLLGKNGNQTVTTKSPKVRNQNLKIERTTVIKQSSLRNSRRDKNIASCTTACDKLVTPKEHVSENVTISNSNNSPESSSDEIFCKKKKTARSELQTKPSSTFQEVNEDKENIIRSSLKPATVMKEGSHFHSFAEFKERLEEFKQTENLQLKISSSRTIANIKDKTKQNTYNQHLRYKELKYVCNYKAKILLAQFKGNPRKPRYFCTFKIELRTSADRQALCISNICYEHNHDLDEEETTEENGAADVLDCSDKTASSIKLSPKKRQQPAGKIVNRKLLVSQNNMNNLLGNLLNTPKVIGSKAKKNSPKGRRIKLSLKKKLTDLQDEVIQEMGRTSSEQVNVAVASDIVIDDDSSPKGKAKAQAPKKQKLLPMVLKPPPKEIKSSKLKANKKSPKMKNLDKKIKDKNQSKTHSQMASVEGSRRPSRRAAVKAKRFMDELAKEDELTILEDSNDKGNLPKANEIKLVKPEKKQFKKDEKLAPIFCKRPKSSEIEVISLTISPAKLMARQDFLQSGVPDQIKKQQIIEKSQEEQLQAWPPFPEVSHVQQRNEFDHIWNLTSPEIKLKPDSSDSGCSVVDPTGFIYEHRIISHKENNEKTILKEGPAIDHALIITILKALKKKNPSFPVYSVFKFYLDLKKKSVESYKRELEKDLNISCVDLTKDEDPKGMGKRKRRSREGISSKRSKVGKGKSKNMEEIKTNETVIPPLWQERIPDVWTQVYAPRKCSQIIGNKGHIKKLKTWLQKWKGKSEAIAVKERNKKSKASKKGGNFIVSDDSDCWEEEEDYISTYLLCGPPGVGKTATVYALASELGYKVLEVNASSKRPGKQVMCQLAEATQSHSVSKSTAQQSNSIASLFSAKSSSSSKGHKLKEAIHDEGSQGSSKDHDKKMGFSLVLFEDIDVVFDESDEGFLATVNNLMTTTKRPIILTLSHMSGTVLSKIKGNYEKLDFESPPEDLIAKHLQLISLVNGQHVCIEDVQSLVSVNKSDIRQSILDLQVWNMSGSSSEKCCCISQVDMVEGDPVVSSEHIAKKDILLSDIFPESICTSKQDFELHSACVWGKFHFRNKYGAEYQHKKCTEDLQRLMWSQVAEHIPFFLPYPLIESKAIQKYPLRPDDPFIKETHLWQRNSWLSLDDDEDETVPAAVEEEKVKEEPEKVIVPKSVEESSRKCIESLASLYNTFADLDVMDSHEIITLPTRKYQEDHGWWVRHPTAGLSDEEGTFMHWAPFGLMQELSEELGQQALRRCLQDTGKVMEGVSSKDWPQFSLPVLEKEMTQIPEAHSSALERLKQEHQKSNKKVLDIVPLVNHLSRDRHMDYLSCMRTFVRHDEIGAIVNKKRRGRRFLSQVSQYGLEISPQDKIKLANALLS